MDRLIVGLDRALRTLFGPARSTRPIPGHNLPEAELDEDEKRHTAALMRVNHCGEVCAQALYQGQAWTSRNPAITRALQRAADEETEHLAWTEKRIEELGGRKSLLNPLWYGGALAIGVVAGKSGDGWNLGFLAETEKQVEAHLADHLGRLPQPDRKSWAILEQMQQDEISHANTAQQLGAQELPLAVTLAMKLASSVMTRTAYWI